LRISGTNRISPSLRPDDYIFGTRELLLNKIKDEEAEASEKYQSEVVKNERLKLSLHEMTLLALDRLEIITEAREQLRIQAMELDTVRQELHEITLLALERLDIIVQMREALAQHSKE